MHMGGTVVSTVLSFQVQEQHCAARQGVLADAHDDIRHVVAADGALVMQVEDMKPTLWLRGQHAAEDLLHVVHSLLALLQQLRPRK